MPISVHAQCVSDRKMNERANSVRRRLQSPWSKHQGGNVDGGDAFAHGFGLSHHCSCTRHAWGVSVVSKEVYLFNCILSE